MKKQLTTIISILAVGVLAILLILLLNRCGKDKTDSSPSDSQPTSSYEYVSDDEMPSVDAGNNESSEKQEWTSLYDTSIID